MMKYWILGILLGAALSQKCNHYFCDIDNSKVPQESFVCMNTTTDAFGNLQIRLSTTPCPALNVCQYSFSDSNDQCVQFISGSLAPGEKCIQNLQCYSGTCTLGKCVGLPLQSDCTFDMECDYGLACGAGLYSTLK